MPDDLRYIIFTSKNTSHMQTLYMYMLELLNPSEYIIY